VEAARDESVPSFSLFPPPEAGKTDRRKRVVGVSKREVNYFMATLEANIILPLNSKRHKHRHIMHKNIPPKTGKTVVYIYIAIQLKWK
jgi:hypothetical protein